MRSPRASDSTPRPLPASTNSRNSGAACTALDGPNRTPFQPLATPGSLAGIRIGHRHRSRRVRRPPPWRRKRAGAASNRASGHRRHDWVLNAVICVLAGQSESMGARDIHRAGRGSSRRASPLRVDQALLELKRRRQLATVRSSCPRTVRREGRAGRRCGFRSEAIVGVKASGNAARSRPGPVEPTAPNSAPRLGLHPRYSTPNTRSVGAARVKPCSPRREALFGPASAAPSRHREARGGAREPPGFGLARAPAEQAAKKH